MKLQEGKELKIISRHLFKAFAIAIMVLIVNCSQPVQNESDKIELVSVWQYLKVFSIYQDRIPNDPFAVDFSQELFNLLQDTLKGGHYTGYSDSLGNILVEGSLRKTSYSNKLMKLDTLTDSCCLLRIPTFQDDYGSVLRQFYNAVPKIGHFSNIILDLRSNGGGLITTTDTIIQCMLPKGKKYIHAIERVYDRTTQKASTLEHDWNTNSYITKQLPEFKNKKLAVLMDNNTGSASEILAIALKDCAGAILVGDKSFGKAIGQVLLHRRERQILKITYLHLYRIIDATKGSYHDYHRIGIAPDSVPAALIEEAKNIAPTYKPVFYAVKMLQPSIIADSIRFPALPNIQFAQPVIQKGLYKDVDESEINLQ